MTRIFGALAVALAVLVTPAMAKRDLSVPADKAWQHAASGLVLPPVIAGLARTAIYDLGVGEVDVTVQHASADASTQATIYVFHPGGGTMPVWFDRAETQIRLRKAYKGAVPTTSAPVPFTPSTGRPIALRRVFTPTAAVKSTGVAALPIGDWLVVVRMSSIVLDTAALDGTLTRFVAELRLPTSVANGPLAEPVKPCATTLKRTRARLVKRDMAQALLGSLLPAIAAKAAATGKAAPVLWCRDGDGNENWGMYRTDNTASYLLALEDSGRLASVGTGLSGFLGAASYGVTVFNLDGSTAQYQSFDRLPLPEQVFDLINRSGPIETTTDGRSTTIFVPEPVK